MSRAEATLVIVYNHKYERNIPLIEAVYREKFRRIFHLVPFYEGSLPNVVPVYENSHYFQGYIAQGLKSFFTPESSHYLFVADDMILNPAITEDTYARLLKLDANASFIPRLDSTPLPGEYWGHNRSGLLFDPFGGKGIEVRGELPDAAQATERLRRHGVVSRPFTFQQVYGESPPQEGTRAHVRHRVRKVATYLSDRFLRGVSLTGTKYPLARSYSDMLVISAASIQRFCHYCGIFAAAELFAELAIPTALALAADKIVTEHDLTLAGKALWTNEELEELAPYGRRLGRLLSDFPPGYLYLHPIKLSQRSVEDL